MESEGGWTWYDRFPAVELEPAPHRPLPTMPDISPLASDIINKIPDLLHKLNRYLDQNGRLVVQCDNLEAEIALIAARLETQRQIRQRMNSVKKSEGSHAF